MDDGFIPDSQENTDGFIPDIPIGKSALDNIAQGLGGINMMIGKGLTDALNVVNPIPSQNTIIKYGGGLAKEYKEGTLGQDVVNTGKSLVVEPIKSLYRDIKDVVGPIADKGIIEGGKEAAENVARRPFDYLMDATMFVDLGPKGALSSSKYVAEKAPTMAENAINSLIKPRDREFSYGKNPGRGVASEGIVATSMRDLGKKVAAKKNEIGRQIQSKITDPKYSAPVGITDAEVVKPIDDAIARVKEEQPWGSEALLNRLENTKRNIMGAIPDGEGGIAGYKKDFSEMTPADLWEEKKKVGDLTNFTLNVKEDSYVNAALKNTYRLLDSKIDSAVPGIADLNSRYADLLGADLAIKHRDILLGRQNKVGLREALALSSGIASGAVGGVEKGALAALAVQIAGSTPGKTAFAATLKKTGDISLAISDALKAIPKAEKPIGATAAGARMADITASQMDTMLGAQNDDGGQEKAFPEVISQGADMERSDHPQLSQQQAEEVAQQELQKDKEGYTKEIKKFERTPHHIKADYKAGYITKDEAAKELREKHGFN